MNIERARNRWLALGTLSAGLALEACTAPLATITPQPSTPTSEHAPIQSSALADLEKTASIREGILSFTLADYENVQTRSEFTRKLADTYVQLTKTTRLTSAHLADAQNLVFLPTREQFDAAFLLTTPHASDANKASTAFADFDQKKVVVDENDIREISQKTTTPIGVVLAGILMHEWGHIDITERTEGVLLNNPDHEFLPKSPDEQILWQKYRGAMVRGTSGRHILLGRFDEIANDSISTLRMQRQIGIPPVKSRYTTAGTDFFIPLLDKLGIGLDELYDKYSSSDLESLATRVGTVLPGEKDPLNKGVRLMFSIDYKDLTLVTNTGVFEVYPDIFPIDQTQQP